VSFVNPVFCSSIGCVIVVYCRLVYMCAPNSGVAKKKLNEDISTVEYHSESNSQCAVTGAVHSEHMVCQACFVP
jgi:hypothetical protein